MVMPDSRFDLIIFDCDGVLIDSEIISAEILISLVSDLGISFDVAYVGRYFLGRSFPTVAETIRREFDVVLPADFEAAYRSALKETFKAELRPTPGIERVLATLSVPYCVATSSSPERACMSLDVAGLSGYFDRNVYTASEVPNGKPAPDLFLHAARKCGADPRRCLVVEDSPPGLEAGRAAGMEVWHYVGGSHLSALGNQTHYRGRVFDCWSNFSDMIEPASNEPASGDVKNGQPIGK